MVGNNYWYIEDDVLGAPEAIWPLMPQLTKIVPGAGEGGDVIKGYIYGRGGANNVKFNNSEVIQFRLPNPHDPYFYGLSPMTAGEIGRAHV